jgi:hypothetical protein
MNAQSMQTRTNSIENIESKIEQARDHFYDKQGGKSWFQKTQQKQECAMEISKRIPLNDLYQQTFYIGSNTNHVYINYPLFKTFAHPDIYRSTIEYILALFTQCIETHGTFEVHVDLKSFTMTATQRYRDLINQFCHECLSRNTLFTSKLTRLSIYNSPKMFDAISAIFSGFIDDQTRTKICIIP